MECPCCKKDGVRRPLLRDDPVGAVFGVRKCAACRAQWIPGAPLWRILLLLSAIAAAMVLVVCGLSALIYVGAKTRTLTEPGFLLWLLLLLIPLLVLVRPLWRGIHVLRGNTEGFLLNWSCPTLKNGRQQNSMFRIGQGLSPPFLKGLLIQVCLLVLSGMIGCGAMDPALILIFGCWNIGLILVRGSGRYTPKESDHSAITWGPVLLFVLAFAALFALLSFAPRY